MLKIIKIQIYVLLALILFLELSLRVVYFNLKSDNYFAISSFIGNFQQRLIGKIITYKNGVIGLYDPVLGYTYLPGEHPVHMSHLNFFGKVNNELKATETVNSEGYRITSPKKVTDLKINKQPELWFLGCSFTYGSYLNDNQTFPWLVQEKFTNYEVKNYSRGGYGQLHYLIQLEHLLKKSADQKNLPKLIVLTYTSFHQERNIQSDERLYKIKDHGGIHVYSYKLPAGRVNSNNELEIYYKGLSDIIDKGKPKIDLEAEKKLKIDTTKAIFDNIDKLANKYQVKMMIAIFDSSMNQDPVLDYLHKRKYDLLYMDVDFRHDRKYNLLPFDPHPNALANQKWAEILIQKLKTNV